jgi:hypothetical protein
MKLHHALAGLVFFAAGCSRPAPSTPTLQDASSPSSAEANAAASVAPVVCDLQHMRVFDMIVTPAGPRGPTPLGQFDAHIRGCGFYIGAQPWMTRIGDQQNSNAGGTENELEWSLEKEPAVGDELFVGYGAPHVATGIRYAGLGKLSVAPTSHNRP